MKKVIKIICIVAAVLFFGSAIIAGIIESITGESIATNSTPTAEPTSAATAKPTSAATAKPSPEVTEEPTPEPTPEATAEPTPKATAKPTVKPTPEATVAPTEEPVSDFEEEEGELCSICGLKTNKIMNEHISGHSEPISYDTLARCANDSGVKDGNYNFSAEVLQLTYDDDNKILELRVKHADVPENDYHDRSIVVYVSYDDIIGYPLVGDVITVYGYVQGYEDITFTTGTSSRVPYVNAYYILQ